MINPVVKLRKGCTICELKLMKAVPMVSRFRGLKFSGAGVDNRANVSKKR